MNTLNVRLPNSLHRQLRELAAREGVYLNQLISSAVGEKLASLLTVAYLQKRAERGTRRAYENVLRKVANVPPEERAAAAEQASPAVGGWQAPPLIRAQSDGRLSSAPGGRGACRK